MTNNEPRTTSNAFRFGTAINCIDGRAQEPVIRWLKENYYLDYIDLITEPGPDKALLYGAPETIERIKNLVCFSIQAHSSNIVALAAHYDCLANPATKEIHLAEIRQALQVIRFWNISASLVGLWVDENGQVEQVG